MGYMTTRHKLLAKNILKYPTRMEAMIKSGYTKEYAAASHILHTEGYKIAMEDTVKQLKKERQRIIDELKIKDLSEERYKDLVDSLDKLSKNINLGEGKPTEIIHDDMSNLTNDQLYELINGNKGISEEGIS